MGCITHRLHSCFSPSSHGFDSQYYPKSFSGKITDVAEVNQRRWLEEGGLWLENGDQTYLVMASGKQVLQKSKTIYLILFIRATLPGYWRWPWSSRGWPQTRSTAKRTTSSFPSFWKGSGLQCESNVLIFLVLCVSQAFESSLNLFIIKYLF